MRIGKSLRARSEKILSAVALGCLLVSLLPVVSLAAEEASVSCLGRIEPADGILRLAGPSGAGSVIAKLEVAEGEWVEKGQVVARLDEHALRKAEVDKSRAQLRSAKRELARIQKLSAKSATSASRLDDADLAVSVAQADLAASRAALELTLVRAPVKAQVLEIHTQPGERIGSAGVMELGRTDQMYVIAEVYETDIARVLPGHSARVATAALPVSLVGRVERVGLKVGKMDVLGTDPIAKADARVVEVHILLEDGARVANLTNLQVEVEILPGTPNVAAGP